MTDLETIKRQFISNRQAIERMRKQADIIEEQNNKMIDFILRSQREQTVIGIKAQAIIDKRNSKIKTI